MMKEGVSTLVQIGPTLGLASGSPGKAEDELILESRWSIPIGLALNVEGQAMAAQGVIVGVEKRGSLYRYRVKVLATDELRKPCQANDLEASFHRNGSEHPGSDRSEPPNAG